MKSIFLGIFTVLVIFVFESFHYKPVDIKPTSEKLKKSFLNPPDAVRPGVYWYFMIGANINF